jgi:hypothetical protein
MTVAAVAPASCGRGGSRSGRVLLSLDNLFLNVRMLIYQAASPTECPTSV